MEDFTVPPRPPQPNADGMPPAYLPPKHKKIEAPTQEELSSPQDEQKRLEAMSDDEFDKMLQEKYPPIQDKPPQCDWHLGSLFSGKYPDPFTLPGLYFAKRSFSVDIAALLTAIFNRNQHADNSAKKPEAGK